MASNFWSETLAQLVAGEDLSAEQAGEAMRGIMSGDATPGQIGAFLLTLRAKGETADELEGLATTMLGFATPVHAPSPVVDTCGTGGDRSGTFNISTVSAIVVAAAGVPVAKHGNRAASSHCGSADVLEALGIKIDLDAAGVERSLSELGIAFMFAQTFHHSMKYAGPVRKELGIPTVFNFLGPLTNPARPFAQVIGVSDVRMMPLMAEVLARRGVRAKLFRGEDGLDELTTTDISTVYDVREGSVRVGHVDPEDLGLVRAKHEDLVGGDATHSAEIVRSILGGAPGPRRDVVLLNAGAALEVAGKAADIAAGVSQAAEVIDSGAASALLDAWVAAERVASPPDDPV